MRFLHKLMISIVALCLAAPASAQWQTPNHSVPIGKGAGVTGFNSVGPCNVGVPIVGAGVSADPTCSAGGAWTGFANPTATIGLTATNGTATTSMRSDGAPALSASVQSALTGTNAYLLAGTGAFGFSSQQYATLAQGGLGGSQAAAAANSVPVFPGSGGAAVPTTLASIFAAPPVIGGTTAADAYFLNINLGEDSTVSALKVGTFGHLIGRQVSDGALLIGGGQVNIIFHANNPVQVKNYLGIGKSPVVPLDIAWPNSTAAYEDSEVPWLGNIIAGQAANPITSAQPMVGISQYSAINTDTTGGQNAALFIESYSNNTSSAGVTAQNNGLTVKTTNIGIGDVVGGYFTATQAGSPLGVAKSYAAFGQFAIAVASTNRYNLAIGSNIIVANNTGFDASLSVMAPPGGYGQGTWGISIQGDGANLNTAALTVYAVPAAKFDQGIYFYSGSVLTNYINAPNFLVDITGNVSLGSGNAIQLFPGTQELLFGGVSSLARSIATGSLTLSTNASDIILTPTGVTTTAKQIVSTLATGTAPFSVASTTLVANLYAAKADILATARSIYGNNFDGSAALTQVIAPTYGGTGYGGGAWTAFTATLTPDVGTVSQTGDASYLKIGRLICLSINVTMTVTSGAPTQISMAGPGGISMARGTAFTGRENAVTGKMIQWQLGGGIFDYANTALATTGSNYMFSGCGETSS